jgi:threonine dehydratase
MIALADVRAAAQRISGCVHRTPVIRSDSLDELSGAKLLFKCENFQRAGAFKARGAFNAVLSLSEAEVASGVVTSSSGNQAAALSLAARTRNVAAYIAMPRIAARAKIAAAQRYGGSIVWVEGKGNVPTSEEYDAAVERIRLETGATPVHPYNDPRTIAGQGTCALEFLEDRPDIEYLLAPVGGGGLLSGTAVSALARQPAPIVIGCEPAGADDARQSLRAGRLIPQRHPKTIADGLRTSLGDITFGIIVRLVHDIVTVSDDEIVRAMRLAWEILKVTIEPSSAVPLAVALGRRSPLTGRTVGIILSGGNVDLDKLPWTSTAS